MLNPYNVNDYLLDFYARLAKETVLNAGVSLSLEEIVLRTEDPDNEWLYKDNEDRRLLVKEKYKKAIETYGAKRSIRLVDNCVEILK